MYCCNAIDSLGLIIQCCLDRVIRTLLPVVLAGCAGGGAVRVWSWEPRVELEKSIDTITVFGVAQRLGQSGKGSEAQVSEAQDSEDRGNVGSAVQDIRHIVSVRVADISEIGKMIV